MGEASVNELPAMLDRQRRAFLADGPPSVAVRRERIDRLMALLLDNTDAFAAICRSALPAPPRRRSAIRCDSARKSR
jgi:hypothetical protein